jgi:Sulfotransferase family
MTAPTTVLPKRLPILFLCGLHRSGTSALARLLGSSPGVRALTGTGVPEDEGQHLQQVYPTAAQHGGPGLFAFDPGCHLTEHSGLATADNARSLLDAWLPFWHLRATDHLGWGPDAVAVLEKSPPNLVRTRLLQALFPRARFIALLRHPAVVTASTAAWRPDLSPATMLRHWLHGHDRFRRDAKKLSHVRVLRYEDLLAGAAATVGDLAAALKFDGRVDVTLLQAGHNERRFADWFAMSPAVRGSDRRQIERGIRRYGYSLEQPYVLPASDGVIG